MISIPGTVAEANLIQKQLLEKLKFDSEFELSLINTFAAIDVSYIPDKNLQIAGIVLFSFPDMKIIEKKSAVSEISFPYVPGYLCFREGPGIFKVMKKLTTMPDLLMVDGHGIAHPRRLGIATYLGIVSGIPSIGVAKKKLIGEYQVPGVQKGSFSWLKHKEETIGVVYRSRSNVKPIFISPGYKIELNKSLEFIRLTIGKYRLPIPIREAHNFVTQERIKILRG
ncbi:MAG: deoxyribonuclease V [Calditrichia bacterium]